VKNRRLQPAIIASVEKQVQQFQGHCITMMLYEHGYLDVSRSIIETALPAA
jgi:hypothetical protein